MRVCHRTGVICACIAGIGDGSRIGIGMYERFTKRNKNTCYFVWIYHIISSSFTFINIENTPHSIITFSFIGDKSNLWSFITCPVILRRREKKHFRRRAKNSNRRKHWTFYRISFDMNHQMHSFFKAIQPSTEISRTISNIYDLVHRCIWCNICLLFSFDCMHCALTHANIVHWRKHIQLDFLLTIDTYFGIFALIPLWLIECIKHCTVNKLSKFRRFKNIRLIFEMK